MSSSDWATVDDLMRDLGAVRRAARDVRAAASARDIAQCAIEAAILDAAAAVDRTIDAPGNAAAVIAAREAIGVAEEVIRALDAEVGRSLKVRARAEALRARASELIQQARGAAPSKPV